MKSVGTVPIQGTWTPVPSVLGHNETLHNLTPVALLRWTLYGTAARSNHLARDPFYTQCEKASEAKLRILRLETAKSKHIRRRVQFPPES